MSESMQYLNFYERPEDRPSVSSEQLIEVAQIFSELFDDVMLHDMDRVKHFEDDMEHRPTANLLKNVVVDRQTYRLALEDKGPSKPDRNLNGIAFTDSEKITRHITLQRMEGVYGRELWNYRLSADGIVRRWDGTDQRKDRELGIEGPELPRDNETFEELGRLALAEIQNLITDVSNNRLEEDMGLNNQPISPDEIRGLQDFLAKATDIPLGIGDT